MVLIAAIAFFLTTAARAQEEQISFIWRDCQKNIEYGPSAPTSKLPGARWLYLTIIMADRKGQYSGDTGLKIAGSLTEACDMAILNFLRDPSKKNSTVTGAQAILIPDATLRLGLEH